jgi:hypothetical protein
MALATSFRRVLIDLDLLDVKRLTLLLMMDPIQIGVCSRPTELTQQTPESRSLG